MSSGSSDSSDKSISDSGSDSSDSSSESEPEVPIKKKPQKNAVNDEEPQVEEEGQPKKESFKWTSLKVMELVHAVMSVSDPLQQLEMPYDKVQVDWDVVAGTLDLPRAKCEEKWRVLLRSTRHFRTLPEVANDIVLQHHKSDIFQHNKLMGNKEAHAPQMKKSKTAVSSNHPAKPKLSAYSIFCEEKAKSVTETGIQKMIRLGQMWKAMDDKTKARYQRLCDDRKVAYVQQVKEYAARHPDDSVIKQTLADLLRQDERKKKEDAGKSRVKVHDTQSNAGSPKKKAKPADDDSSTQEEADLNQTLPAVSEPKSPMKRHHSDTESPRHPKKKKAKKVVKVTAEDVYVEERFDDYKVSKPDLSDEEVRNKLMHKFGKLSEKKMAKYQALAEERNG